MLQVVPKFQCVTCTLLGFKTCDGTACYRQGSRSPHHTNTQVLQHPTQTKNRKQKKRPSHQIQWVPCRLGPAPSLLPPLRPEASAGAAPLLAPVLAAPASAAAVAVLPLGQHQGLAPAALLLMPAGHWLQTKPPVPLPIAAAGKAAPALPLQAQAPTPVPEALPALPALAAAFVAAAAGLQRSCFPRCPAQAQA